MLIHFSVLLIGFTIFSAFSLIIAYFFFLPGLQKSVYSKLACVVLLCGLASLQWCHYLSLTSSFQALDSRLYLLALLSVPASFYYFSRFVLYPDAAVRITQWLHLLPVIAGFFLPEKTIPPMAFMIGSAYCLWYIHVVLKSRTQQNRFHMERFFFGLFAILALSALLIVVAIPYIEPTLYYLAYGNAIGIAMLLVSTAIMVFPDMLSDIQQAAEMAYAKSKLTGVDVTAKKSQLEKLMRQEHVYQNEKLSLSTMADMLDLSPHQLSELVNTAYGFGFSRLIRTLRIEQAKKLLIEEPKTSVLAISIMTGFQSQSNFYTAFKEVTADSPANYRNKQLQP